MTMLNPEFLTPSARRMWAATEATGGPDRFYAHVLVRLRAGWPASAALRELEQAAGMAEAEQGLGLHDPTRLENAALVREVVSQAASEYDRTRPRRFRLVMS